LGKYRKQWNLSLSIETRCISPDQKDDPFAIKTTDFIKE
jgi:hypothetical protein